MKYLMLFEGYKSKTLSNVLMKIPNREKEKFMNLFSSILDSLDFPLSELNDDIILYKNYHEAIEYTADTENRPTSYSPRLMKFWFGQDGEFLGQTLTDIIYKSTLSQNVDNYNIIKELTHEELFNLETGSIVKLKINAPYYDEEEKVMKSGGDFIGTIYQKTQLYNSGTYFIQDFISNCEPNSDDWKQYGNSAFGMSRYANTDEDRDYVGVPLLLDFKKESFTQERVPSENIPFDFNNRSGLKPGRSGQANPYVIIRKKDNLDKFNQLLKTNASYAVILDCLKLTQLGKSLKDIVFTRKSQKDQAISSDEKIKKMNLDRYLSELLNSIVSLEVKDYKKVVLKFLGGRYLGFTLFQSSNFKNVADDLSELTSRCYQYLTSELEITNRDPEGSDMKKQEQLKKNIIKLLSDTVEKRKMDAETYEEQIKVIKNRFPKAKDFLDKVVGINNLLYDKFSKMEYETLEDLLIVQKKVDLVTYAYVNYFTCNGLFLLNRRSVGVFLRLAQILEVDEIDDEDQAFIRGLNNKIDSFERLIKRL